MKKQWVLIDATGIDNKKSESRVVKFSKANVMSTAEAIGYLADFE